MQKKSVMSVFTKDRSTLLGEADFDLAKYANDTTINRDRIPLGKCASDDNAFISVGLKVREIVDGN